MQNEELILVETPIKYLDWNYPYFTVKEMVCQHTGYLGFNERFMDSLVTLREKCGFGFPVNSYYRHADYINIENSHPIERKKLEASNGKKAGSHASGKAIDIGVDRERAYIVLRTAMDMGIFSGIGINQKGNSRFIHLDTCNASDGFTRPTIWSY
tara:strand:+ start:8049 stop:8513 length:465 start_codon:yes stop_codon:yes gene_type:complete